MAIKYKVKLNAAKIKRQYLAGKKVVEIARQAGFPKNCGQNRVRALLMKLGVYKGWGKRVRAHQPKRKQPRSVQVRVKAA